MTPARARWEREMTEAIKQLVDAAIQALLVGTTDAVDKMLLEGLRAVHRVDEARSRDFVETAEAEPRKGGP